MMLFKTPPLLAARVQEKSDRLLRFCTTLFFVLLVAISIAMISWGILLGPEAVSNGMAHARPYLAVWRIFLFIVMIGGWPIWVKWLLVWSEIETKQVQFLRDYRWRMACWLLIFEVLFVRPILVNFFHTILF